MAVAVDLRSGEGSLLRLSGEPAFTARPASFAEPTRIALARTPAEVQALEADWNDLFERAGRSVHVFQTFAWNWHWITAFRAASDTTLAVATARRAGRLVAVWPLVVERHAGVRLLTWMGDPVTQYGDVLVEDVPDKAAILEETLAAALAGTRADVVMLRKVRADAEVAPFLARQGTLVTQRLEAPYVDLASAPDFARYEERFSAKARKNRRRQARRLAERGEVTVQRLGAGEEAASLAKLAVAQKCAWLRERGLLSRAFADRRTHRFFAAVAGDATRPAGTLVTALRTANEVAAVQIGFRCKGRLALHVISYTPKFERWAAGALLFEEQLRASKGEGVAVCDFLAPKADYKMEWADGTVEVCDHAQARTAAGRAYVGLYLARVRPALSRAAAEGPAFVRRLAGSGRATLQRCAERVGLRKSKSQPSGA